MKKVKKLVSSFCQKVINKCNGITLAQLLIVPVQRIPRYRLLIQEMINSTEKTHPDYNGLNKALETIKKFAETVNENVRITERTHEFDKLCKKIPRLQSIKSAMIFSSTDLHITLGQNKYSTLILFFDRIIVASDQKKGEKKIEFEYPLDLVWPDALDELSGSKDAFRILLPEEQFIIKHSNTSLKKKWID